MAAIADALVRLAYLQDTDGGFSPVIEDYPRLDPDVVTTAEVVRALATLKEVADVEPLLSDSLAFVLAAQNMDGGFPAVPGGPSETATTALVLDALVMAAPHLVDEHLDGQGYLAAAQSMDGSFDADPYTTALAIQALGNARPDLRVPSVVLSAPRVDEGTIVDVTVRVRNDGVAPSVGTDVDLFRGDPNAAGVLVDTAAIGALDPGEWEEVELSIDTMGHPGSLPLFAIVDRTQAILELNETNNRRVVVLRVTPDGEDAPSLNKRPVITSSPVTSATLGGDYSYDVQATDPDTEAVTFSLGTAPAGMTIDSGTGLIEWDVPAVPAAYQVLVLARDPHGATAGQSFTIAAGAAVSPRPPRFLSAPSSAAVPEVPYNYYIDTEDPDGSDVVTLRLLASPPDLTLIGDSVEWEPTLADVGEHVVHLQAVDNEGDTADQQWLIVVRAEAVGADMAVVEVDPSAAVTDPQSLAIDGVVRVHATNVGDSPVPEPWLEPGVFEFPPFGLIVFEDRNGDERFGPEADYVLGTAEYPWLGAAYVDVSVFGNVLFRDNRIFAFIDSTEMLSEPDEANNYLASGRERRFVPVPGPIEAELELGWYGMSGADLKEAGYLESRRCAHHRRRRRRQLRQRRRPRHRFRRFAIVGKHHPKHHRVPAGNRRNHGRPPPRCSDELGFADRSLYVARRGGSGRR